MLRPTWYSPANVIAREPILDTKFGPFSVEEAILAPQMQVHLDHHLSNALLPFAVHRICLELK
jgi:hypothetical protein